MNENKITITPKNQNYFLIDFKDKDLQRAMIHKFTFAVPNAHFDPRVKKGYWNGKVGFLSSIGIFPIGLFSELMDMIKKPIYEVKFGKPVFKIKGMTFNKFATTFLQPTIVLPWTKDPTTMQCLVKNPKYKIRDYQENGVLDALKFGRGMFQYPTGTGKTLLIYLIAMSYHLALRKNNKIFIVVPNITLLEQTTNDFHNYALKEFVTQVGDGSKDIKNGINVMTWQTILSMIKRKEITPECDIIIVDECHGLKSGQEIQKTVEFFKDTKYRLGFTATIPEALLEQKQMIASLGPIRRTYVADTFIQKGILANGVFHIIKIHHDPSKYSWDDSYQELRDKVFSSQFRLELLISLIEKLYLNNEKILIITSTNEKEAFLLYDLIKGLFPEKYLIEYKASLKKEEREILRHKIENDLDKAIIISNYRMFRLGIDIPSLQTVIFASSTKSDISIPQTIGRTLRPDGDKVSKIYDIVDINVPHMEGHFNKRLELYKKHYASLNFKYANFYE